MTNCVLVKNEANVQQRLSSKYKMSSFLKSNGTCYCANAANVDANVDANVNSRVLDR